ncbi:HigA family addiction module antitoxin [Gluconacetobacter diazotrophicus]|nr:HigA family addiction module antitoxin [Gluconacetobacter diazotrophicus]CAP54315.1 putative plasmid maintenance system antidote protein [Gluconacetobacter diazotrophicus PA1 5]
MHPSLAVHVGEWLKTEVVEPNGIRINDLAGEFGVSRQALSALLNGRGRLSADMAIRFEMAFGVKADTLMRMQVAHDMAQARKHEGELRVRRLVAA